MSNVKTVAAIMTESAIATKAGNAPTMDALNAALAEAERNARGPKTVKPLAGITPGLWGLVSATGPFASGTATDGHRRLMKGVLPRLPAADRAKLEAILRHYSVKL
jgi:hypothetical protein